MGKYLFYIFNFIGITVYYLFGRKAGAVSPLVMFPFVMALGIILLSILKYFMSGRVMVSKIVFTTAVLVLLSLLVVFTYSHLNTHEPFNYSERINSLRRYFGVFVFFFAFVGLGYLSDLKNIKLTSYLKFVILLVAVETILESLLLNLHIISHLDLPLSIGSEYIGVEDVTFRPYGFLGATSALGTFLLMLFYLSYGLKNEIPKWLWILSFISFAITFSVTSYSIFTFLCILTLFTHLGSPKRMCVALAVLISLTAGLYYFIETLLPGKLTFEYYVEMIYVVWAWDVEHYLSYVYGLFDILFGAQPFDSSFGILSQDLPYVTWLSEVGALGVLVFAYLSMKILLKLDYLIPRKFIFAVILCMFLGMLHYPILIFIPTQIFLGCLMYFAARSPEDHICMREEKENASRTFYSFT